MEETADITVEVYDFAMNLVVNRHPGKTEGPHLHHALYGSLLQHRVNNGFMKKRVRVELESGGKTAYIFDDFIKPCKDIWFLVPRSQDATVFIFEDDKLVQTRLYEAW